MDLVCNKSGATVGQSLSKFSKDADEIWLAVAFVSRPTLLDEWLERNCRLRVLVALAYPTDPRVLQQLKRIPAHQAEVRFYDPGFHSKLYVFRKEALSFAALIGSSNFTKHGLGLNIETNLSVRSKRGLVMLEAHFKDLWQGAKPLVKADIERYKAAYSRLKRMYRTIRKRHEQLHHDLEGVEPREARTYERFRACLDDVARIVAGVSKKEWPRVPLYLSVDHFMYWLVNEWNGAERGQIRSEREVILPKLFKLYADWDKSHQNFTGSMPATSRELQNLLSKPAVNNLTKDGAKQVYKRLHSGKTHSRFLGDKKFVTENNLKKIRSSLNHLLWSEDDITKRISDLITNDRYRLKHFGPSMVQEIIGWVRPDKWPIRNRKADKALEILDYNLS